MADVCMYFQSSAYSLCKISIDQVHRLSYMDQLTLLCISNSFNMKNNFYIDVMDLFYIHL